MFAVTFCFFRTLLRHDHFWIFWWPMFYRRKHWQYRLHSHFGLNWFALIRAVIIAHFDRFRVYLVELEKRPFCDSKIQMLKIIRVPNWNLIVFYSHLGRNFSFFRVTDIFGGRCLLSQIFSLFSLLMKFSIAVQTPQLTFGVSSISSLISNTCFIDCWFINSWILNDSHIKQNRNNESKNSMIPV